MKGRYQYIFRAMTLAFAFIILFTGCRQDVTRKADWEVNFTDLHFADAEHGWIVGEKGDDHSYKRRWKKRGNVKKLERKVISRRSISPTPATVGRLAIKV